MNLEAMTKPELLNQAASLGLTPNAASTKAQLIEQISSRIGEGEPVAANNVAPDPTDDPAALPTETDEEAFAADVSTAPAQSAPVSSTPIVDASAPPVPPPPVRRERRLMRSELKRLVEDFAKRTGVAANTIDRFRFIRDNGLPNPVALFSVSGRRVTKDGPIPFEPVRVYAVDEGDAVRAALDVKGVKIRDRHRWNMTVVLLEE